MSPDNVSDLLRQSLAALNGLTQHAKTIGAIADVVADALAGGATLFLCGNGGSAAQCQHVAAEFTGRFKAERAALRAVALTTDTSALTAIGNDYGFENVFARQLDALARPGDVLIGISTSGSSKNVIAAFEKARTIGVKTVALVGPRGGPLAALAGLALAAPGPHTANVQESHLVALHVICELVERRVTRPERTS